jgi:hypothetical protein
VVGVEWVKKCDENQQALSEEKFMPPAILSEVSTPRDCPDN